MIELKHINLMIQKREILHDISLAIPKGSCVAIIGPSGSGKTSLLRTINGLIPNFYEGKLSGDLIIDNHNFQELADYEISRLIGTVSQDPRSQFFTNSVRDELCFEMENFGYKQADILLALNQTVETFNLDSIIDSSLTQLSSGQKQRVAIASAYMSNPDYFVFDEPSANLDLTETNRLNKIIHNLKKKQKTIILSEHRIYYLMDVVDQFILVNDGKIEQIYTSNELKALPEKIRQQFGIRIPNMLNMPKKKKTIISKTEPSLSINSLDAGYKRKAILKDLNFNQTTNSITALIGANGSGKTTLAKTLIGLQKENKGDITLYETKTKRKERLNQVWMVMQETIYQVFSDSVLNELTLKKETTTDYLEKCHQILDELMLTEFSDHHPASLSGGQRQRLTIAIGLLEDRDFIILDEPTSGLDYINMKRVADLLRTIADKGKTILVITHDPEFIVECCDNIALLKDGEITASLPLSQLNNQDLIELMTF